MSGAQCGFAFIHLPSTPEGVQVSLEILQSFHSFKANNIIFTCEASKNLLKLIANAPHLDPNGIARIPARMLVSSSQAPLYSMGYSYAHPAPDVSAYPDVLTPDPMIGASPQISARGIIVERHDDMSRPLPFTRQPYHSVVSASGNGAPEAQIQGELVNHQIGRNAGYGRLPPPTASNPSQSKFKTSPGVVDRLDRQNKYFYRNDEHSMMMMPYVPPHQYVYAYYPQHVAMAFNDGIATPFKDSINASAMQFTTRPADLVPVRPSMRYYDYHEYPNHDTTL